MDAECVFCGRSTRDSPSGVVTFGPACNHSVHRLCYHQSMALTDECTRCSGVDVSRLRHESLITAGSGHDRDVFGAAWRAWELRAAAGPVHPADMLDVASAASAGKARRDVQFVSVDVDDILQVNANPPVPDDLISNGQAVHLAIRAQRYMAFTEWIDVQRGAITVQDLKSAGFTFDTVESYVVSDQNRRSFLAWKRRFKFGGRELVELGATWEQLLDTGLQAGNFLSVFSNDIACLSTLSVTYQDVLNDICNGDWMALAQLGLTADQLGRQLRLNARAMSLQENCTAVFQAMSQTYTIDDFVQSFHFTMDLIDDMYAVALHRDTVSQDKFRHIMCVRVLGWTNADCERVLGIRFQS